MNKIRLEFLGLKTVTEQDIVDYCSINNINSDDITYLNLQYNNKLTDISGIKLFKNLERLELQINQIKDISVIQYLNSLERLSIEYLELESDQIKYINSGINIEYLWCNKGFKDMSVLKQLNKNIKVYL